MLHEEHKCCTEVTPSPFKSGPSRTLRSSTDLTETAWYTLAHPRPCTSTHCPSCSLPTSSMSLASIHFSPLSHLSLNSAFISNLRCTTPVGCLELPINLSSCLLFSPVPLDFEGNEFKIL
jgi:hypothetical protein